MDKHIKIGTGKAKLNHSKWVQDSPIRDKWGQLPGHRVATGTETADIEVWVDVEALVKAIGFKALKTQTGATKLQEGAVILKAVNRATTQEGK